MSQKVAELILYGVFSGTIYGLVGMGLGLQYSVCRILNITHGEFVMLGAVVTWALARVAGIHPLIAPLIIVPLLFVLGFFLQATLFRGLKARAPSQPAFEGNALLAAFGMMYIIKYLTQLRFGSMILPTSWYIEKVPFFGLSVYGNQLIAFAICMSLAVALHLFLTRSRLGRAIMATAEDPVTAGLMGVNTNMILPLSFGLGALVAGMAGVAIVLKGPVSTEIGFESTVIALIVVTLGGLGSIPGAFIAGIIIGMISMVVTRFWEPILTVPVYYAMLMVLLLLRPSGILGKK